MDKSTHYFWWILALFCGWLVYLLGPVLTPFLIAGILAYIANPIVHKIDRLQIRLMGRFSYSPSRTCATLLVMLLLFTIVILLLLIAIPLLQKEISLLIQKIPTYLNILSARIAPWLERYFGVSFSINHEQIQSMLNTHWKTAGDFAKQLALGLGNQGMAMIGWLANLILIPVVLFYLLLDWNVMLSKIQQLIPRKYAHKTEEIACEIDRVLAAFLRGQLTVMLLMSLFYALALWFVGLELALPIGILAGLLGFVPYLGIAIGLGLAVISGLLQFGTLHDLIPILVVFGLGQLIESMALTPYLVGDRIGLHPLAVIFALMAAGQLFGFAGVLLALPVSAAIAVAFKHAKQRYLTSRLYHN